MGNLEPEKQRQIARRIAARVDEPQRAALRSWIEQLLALKESNMPAIGKAKKAISLTANSQFLTATAKLIADAATPSELRMLAEKLVAINASQNGLSKATQATTVIAKGLKSAAWDNRSLTARLGLSGAIAGAVFFGGQGAGIAALGTAIGVPLWVVFGAGAAFLGVLYDEISGKKSNPKTTYRVIDAEPEHEE
jgi:hypothetical protein